MSLKDIPVRIAAGPDSGNGADSGTGMALALLREIADHLNTVAAGGERQVVGLGSLPLTEADRALLSEKLGRGEVEATVSALGPTEVYETAFAGVWWVKYMNDGGIVVAEQIEIGRVPVILESDPADIRDSAERFPGLFTENAAEEDRENP